MNNNLQISTRVRRLFHYLEDFEKGIIRVPAFQRDFEWKHEKKIKLFDSIKQGYPIGSILFWRPDFTTLEDFKNFESNTIGSYFLKERASDYFYILDGYQRLSTLFGCLVNPDKTPLDRDEKEWKKEFNLIYNLEDDQIKFSRSDNYQIYEVPLYKFIDGREFYNFQKDLLNTKLSDTQIENYLERYRNFGIKLSSYDIPSIDMIGGTTEEAIDIFTRLNSEGAKITSDWKLSALSFNKLQNFRLGSEIDNLLKSLEQYNFQKLKRKIVFQCITNSFGGVFFDKSFVNDTKELQQLARKDNFVGITRNTFSSIAKAVDFLYSSVFVNNSKFLPYSNQLIFITDFFNQLPTPRNAQLSVLKTWFWVTTYSNYFTRYNLSKQRKAYQQFQQFIKNKNTTPIYYDNGIGSFESAEFPAKISMGSVRSKALSLFMLQYQIEHSGLKIENSGKIRKLKLFKHKGNTSENTVLVFSDFVPYNTKDLSHWLNEAESREAFFISEKMKEVYKKSMDEEYILNLRRDDIIKAESIFVESLGIQYKK